MGPSGDDRTGKQVEGEVDLHPGGGTELVGVRWESVEIGLRYHLPWIVVDQDPPDQASFELPGDHGEALLYEIAENGHEEGG
jgi:hypothetical protein